VISPWLRSADRLPRPEDCDEKGAVWVWDGLQVVPKLASKVNPTDFPFWLPRLARRRPQMPGPLV